MEQIGIKNNTKLRLTQWRGLTRKIEKMQFFLYGCRDILVLEIYYNIMEHPGHPCLRF